MNRSIFQRSRLRLALLGLAALCAFGLALGPTRAVHAQTSPLRQKLDGPIPAQPQLVPYKVEEPKKDKLPSPRPGAAPPPPPPPPPASQTVSFACPLSTSEGGASEAFPGWSFETAWVQYLGLDVVNPASMGAGAVVECLYGSNEKAPGFPAYYLMLRQNLGAGATAQTCTVNGSSVSCSGRAPITCPQARFEHGPSRTWSGWSFETLWADRFVGAAVINPPSMNAGASVECRYGSTAVRPGNSLMLTLRRNLGRGIDKNMCRLDAPQRTATCTRPA